MWSRRKVSLKLRRDKQSSRAVENGFVIALRAGKVLNILQFVYRRSTRIQFIGTLESIEFHVAQPSLGKSARSGLSIHGRIGLRFIDQHGGAEIH